MDFKKAYWVALATTFALASCSTTSTDTRRPASPPMEQGAQISAAPESLSAARSRLTALGDDALRVDTALAWASEYLQQQRPEDTEQLLGDLNPDTLSREQRFQWILLGGRAALSQQTAAPAVALLARYEDEILQYPVEQQAQLDLLRADALAMEGKLLDSLQQRVAAHPLLNDQDQDYNHGMIWQLLMQLPPQELASAAQSSSGDLRGWLMLAQLYRDPIADLDAQVTRLDRWSAQWRSHPAIQDVPAMLEALKEAASHRPSQVAILLPTSGPLQNVGKTLQEGIMTAHYQQEKSSLTPTLRFYDSGPDNILAVYQQAINDGADFVLGPLSKEKATTIASQGPLPVTTLALNYIETEQVPENFFQFGLAPEDEARQIARQGAREGSSQAGVLYPKGEWGQRVAQAFVDEWQNLNGTVTVSSAYQEGPDIGETVKDLLLVDQSQQRGKEISRFTNLEMDIQPRRRQDMDFLFLIANPNQGRQVKPALNFHYAKDLPVYSTALIYSGTPNPRRDQDLNGIRFVDMPWVIGNQDSEIHRIAAEQWPDGHGRFARLYAMGIDAYRLQGRLYLLNTLPASELPGVTGRLSMRDQQVVRKLDWAIFMRGEAKALPQVTNPADSLSTRAAASAP